MLATRGRWEAKYHTEVSRKIGGSEEYAHGGNHTEAFIRLGTTPWD